MSQLEDEGRRGKRGEPLPEDHQGLPDSSRPRGLCPRCNKQSSFGVGRGSGITYNGFCSVGSPTQPTDFDRVCVLLCRHCGQGTAVIEEKWVGDYPAREKRPESGGKQHYRGIHWWPLPDTNLSKDIPEDIAGAFAEASSALHAHCPRAAVVMARRTLEAVTVDKGETQETLDKRLKNLAANGILSPNLAEWAREVRLVGNTGAHYDPLNPVSVEDANELVGFLRELLRHIYELPAQIDRRRSSRQKKP